MINQKGFTLLETILVLTIATIVIPITFNQYAAAAERQELNGFTARLQDLIHYAQMSAVSEEKYAVVYFNNDFHRVDVLLDSNVIKSLEASSHIQFEKGTHSLTITLSPKGTIVDRAGSLYVKTEHFTKKVIFLLGQGRFYVETL